MAHSTRPAIDRKDGGSHPSQESRTELPFALDATDGPTAADTAPAASAAPEPSGAGSGHPPEPRVAAAAVPEPGPSDLEAAIEAKRASIHRPEPPGSDPFDVNALRLGQDFGSAGVRKKLVYVPVDKPLNEWFVRTHPEEAKRLPTRVLQLKQDRELYLVLPPLWADLEGEPTFSARLLALAVNRQGNPFLWPVRLPGPDGKLDPWSQSAFDACEMARTEWVRLKSNTQIGAYDVSVASFKAEPEWPEMTFTEILRIAFKGKVISDWDHPVLRRLRGEI